MVNKKISRILGPVLGIMGFMLTAGIVQQPVLAADNVQTNYASTTSTEQYKDYSININKSAEQNGIKVTLDKVVGTNHTIKVIIKIESETAFDKTKIEDLDEDVTFGGVDHDEEGFNATYDYPDNKTILITRQQTYNTGKYPEKGDLKVNVTSSNYNVNIGIDAAVDFSGSLNKVIDKDFSASIPLLNYSIEKLQSDVLSTRLVYSTDEDDSESQKGMLLLKVGDKIYPMIENGTYHSENKINDDKIREIFTSNCATYDNINGQENISIIPIVSYLTSDEVDQIAENTSSKQTLNNVNYQKSFEFSDGSKGEIYNIERNANTVKVHFKGNTEKESLLMGTLMTLTYADAASNPDCNVFYEGEDMSFYKDSNNTNGYVAEFDNVSADKTFDLTIAKATTKIDKFTIGDTVQLSK